MTYLIIRDKSWFIDEVEFTVDGFLDLRGHIHRLIMKRVFEQIFMSACTAKPIIVAQ